MAHRLLKEAEVFLDRPGRDLHEIVGRVLDDLTERQRLDPSRREQARGALAALRLVPTDLGHGVGVLRLPVASAGRPAVALLGLRHPHAPEPGTSLRLVWIVVGDNGTDELSDEALEPFGWMLIDDRFNVELLGHPEDDIDHGLLAVFRRYLEFLEAPPVVERQAPVELQPTGRVFGGVLADLRRRLPHYRSDFTEGSPLKVLAATLFTFFACVAPAVAFGGLLSVLTDGAIGVTETLVASAACGIVWALGAGQPLLILGPTGPTTIFLGILYAQCAEHGIAFLPAAAWVGLWTAAMLLACAAFEASRFVGLLTRFTDEIFAGLIALIYLVEAITDIFVGLRSGDGDGAGFLHLILALGTYIIAAQLSRFRQSVYLRRRIREFLADFGPTIAIVTMTAVALYFHETPVATLEVPDTLDTTSGRPWIVDPFAAPVWIWGAAALPAALLTVLLFVNQSVTARLVNDPAHHLRKGAAYHWDLLLLAVLVAGCAVFGLPPVVAAVVRSINHVNSLAQVESRGGRERIVGVLETRLTGLGVHALIAVGAWFLLDLLARVPMAVLFGMFLFMGIVSLRTNQFAQRMRLWLTDPGRYPPTHYVRRLPRRVVHAFTAIQAALLALLWIVQNSPLGIAFPLLIGLLVPIRRALTKVFGPRALSLLDADEEPAEEQYRDLK